MPHPNDPAAIFAEAQQHFAAGRMQKCVELCERGLGLAPGHPAFAAMQFNAAIALGDPEACWRPMLQAAGAVGDHLDFLSHLATAANYSVTASPEEVWRCHEGYGKALERRRPGAGSVGPSDKDPDRRLRVGVVSYDFRIDGSVGFFLSPLFTHLGRGEFELYAYQTRPLPDAQTEFFRANAAAWRQVPESSPDEIARTIRADRIDIAIDINGHSGVRTIPAFQPRCAPVQVSYMGYSNTTGSRAFDWRIVDSRTDPPPPHASDRHAAERLFRLDPCFLCYTPSPSTPALPSSPPSARAGHVTFGAFSELAKLNSRTLALWSRVLAAAPGSRLLLKNRAMENPDTADHLRRRLVAAGIDPARAEMLPRTRTFADHLKAYERVDIALDTTPYNGTTTVCEALLMGVPLLAVEPPPLHDRHAARVALSLLNAAGLGEFVAPSDDAFVAAAAALADDRDALARHRRELRARFMASPVCDAGAFCGRFGAALREMWKRWCEVQ
jgi:protein O-GlcNAc transferase